MSDLHAWNEQMDKSADQLISAIGSKISYREDAHEVMEVVTALVRAALLLARMKERAEHG